MRPAGRGARRPAGPTQTTNVTPTTNVVTSVRRRGDKAVPLAFASVFEAAPGRTRAMATLVCPACGGGHLHRAANIHDFDGRTRRGGCGARYQIVVKRRYQAGEAA